MHAVEMIKGLFSRPAKRSNYDAAKVNRLTFDWAVSPLSIDSEIKRSLKALRFRCRDLERNNDYMRSLLRIFESQVIGKKGVTLQMNVRNDNGGPDRLANQAIEKAWSEWSKRGICTMDGRMSWPDVERLFIRSVARDGELLVRKVRGPTAGNRFNFAVHLLEADHLDEDDTRQLGADRRVRMGVEANRWNRPLAYHLWPEHPGEDFLGQHRHDKVRIPAGDMVHAFIMERAGQTRGLPWLVSAMRRLNMLGGYEEAELVAARVSASKMGFFHSPDGEGYTGSGDDDRGNIVTEAEPGQFEQLPDGLQFTPFDPQHPTTAFSMFHRAMLRGVAASIGASYATVSGDLESVNFSSLRQGALSERDCWQTIQNWTISALHEVVFADWLEMALTSNAIGLPLAKFDKFNAPKWQPRGWAWVDPQKEATANATAIDSGTKTLTEVLGERGRGLEEVLEEREREQEMFASFGISAAKPTPKQGSDDDEDDNEDD